MRLWCLILVALAAAPAAWARGKSHSLDSRCVPVFGETKLEGMRCTEIKGSSVLHKAGVQDGDVVTSVDGRPTLSPRDMMQAIQGLRDSGQAKIKVRRGGRELTLSYVR